MTALPSLAERITESFYAWEVRGRGWQVAPYPVVIEPVFRHCRLLPKYEPPSTPLDDGRRPTFLSSLLERTRGLFVAGPGMSPAVSDEEPFEELPPHHAGLPSPLTTFRVLVAADQASESEVAISLLRALSAALQPVSLELYGGSGTVSVQVSCRETDREHVQSSIEGFIPEASVIEDEDLFLEGTDASESVVVDFGLSEEFFLPIRTFSSFRIDPYITLVAGLSRAKEGEWVCFQILFERARNPWDKAIGHALVAGDGTPMFADAPEFLPLAKEKTKTTLFATVLRVAAAGETEARAFDLARGVGAFVMQFERPGSNALVPLENDDYPATLHLDAFRARSSYRTGMLLSTEELIGLVHIPDASIRQAALIREDKQTKAAPASTAGHAYVLGENCHRGRTVTVSLDESSRFQHMHILGASGTGKSTLLLQLIMQDVLQGHGLAVLDPHGDLIDDLLARIPPERTADVVVFDPADEAFPVGLNVLSAQTTLEQQLLASDLVSIFQRLSTSWGDTMSAVLSNAVLAILEHEDGGTLLDLRRFLLDESFRREFLRGVADEEVQFFWTTGFKLIGTRSIGPILTRLDAFLRPKLIRHVVGQRRPKLDFGSILPGGKIFLAKLSQGLIGVENASLLGSLLATRFHQLALARQQSARADRRPFYLYADEAQHFVTPSMAGLLTDVRKYSFGLVLSHQNLFQLRGSPVESALLGNAYTRIAFRVGDDDGKRLAEGCSYFEAKDFRGLARGEAIVRIGTADQDCNLCTLPLVEIDAELARTRRDAIRQSSRDGYASTLEDVRCEIASGAPVVGKATDQALEPLDPPRPVGVAPPDAPDRGGPIIDEVSPLPVIAEPVPPHPTVRRRQPPVVTPDLGRGGPEHRYLQQLVKRLAEERNFRATIEEAAGDGQADVVLRRDDLSIAIEVSVTTETAHELSNVQKCLLAGFGHVALLCSDPRRVTRYRKALSEVPWAQGVRMLEPADIAGYLDAFPAPEASSESTVRGYKVRINRQAQTPEDAAERRRKVAQTIARSLRKSERE